MGFVAAWRLTGQAKSLHAQPTLHAQGLAYGNGCPAGRQGAPWERTHRLHELHADALGVLLKGGNVWIGCERARALLLLLLLLPLRAQLLRSLLLQPAPKLASMHMTSRRALTHSPYGGMANGEHTCLSVRHNSKPRAAKQRQHFLPLCQAAASASMHDRLGPHMRPNSVGRTTLSSASSSAGAAAPPAALKPSPPAAPPPPAPGPGPASAPRPRRASPGAAGAGAAPRPARPAGAPKPGRSPRCSAPTTS